MKLQHLQLAKHVGIQAGGIKGGSSENRAQPTQIENNGESSSLLSSLRLFLLSFVRRLKAHAIIWRGRREEEEEEEVKAAAGMRI